MALDNLDFDLDDLSTARSDDSDGIKSLRNALKAVKDQLKASQTELDTYRGEKRKQTLSELLESKGVKGKAQSLYPKDAEATEEAVTAWVAEFGEAFGLENPQTTAVPTEQQQAMQQMQDASAQAPAPLPGDVGTIMARLQAAQTREEAAAIYAELGWREV
jgi:hypothetical protein